LPSTAAEAGKLAFSVEEAVAVLPWATFAVPQVAAAARGAVAVAETRTERKSAAIASRLIAARRRAGAPRVPPPDHRRCQTCTFTFDLRVGVTIRL
jgi:hypothetical protein